MGGANLQGVYLVKGRIALYAGYFVAMLLLAAYFTGVLQEGILPRFRHQEATEKHDEQSAVSDQHSASQKSDEAPVTGSAPEGQALSPSPEDKPAVTPTPQKPVESLSNPSKQISVSTGPPSPPPSDDQEKPVLSRVGGSATAADRQEKLLAEKRTELLQLEEQIRKRKEESETEGKWLAELKASGAKLTKERDARREAGIKKLAKLYEGMEPEAAASILSKLDKNMAAEVLVSMKDRQASKVLAAMNGQKARDLSERLQEARLDQTAGQGKAPFDQAQGRPRPGSGRAAEETP
ncbi:MotE family protein [Candidatus Methylomirabilis sp.]|uniref:MotE family protein n=1 Tax=Candidatus Methylomirabilis sp. TaxID=2032687 RepID=UPI003C72088E